MSEEASTPSERPAATGPVEVDEVVAEVDALAERPLAEHAAGFESAHQRLRRALDEPGAAASGSDD